MIQIRAHDIPAGITIDLGTFDWAHLTYHELRAGRDGEYDQEIAYMDEEGFWRVYSMKYHKWTDVSLDA